MTLSKKILIGLVAGIAVGLFFGERAAVLDWPAKAFVQLLGVTVLPYLVTSLVTGIARGTPAEARRLASRGGGAIVLLWAVSLVLVFLSPLALPPDKGGSFYAATLPAEDARIDWIDLYIPANPFRSLANNVVPAVVVFSVILGVALLGVPDKERLLAPLRLVGDVLGRAGSLVVRLTPIGIFAIAGHASGTMRIEEIARLEAFLILYIGLSLILTFWILPGLVSALTGLPHRRIVSVVWDPLITAFVTANLFVVLPLLQERAKHLLKDMGRTDAAGTEAADVLVPASFTLPHSAKLLSLCFVLFAGWFVGAPVPPSQYGTLATAGLLSLFGSLNTAVPFLLDLVRLPADLFQLFVVSSVANSRFGSAAAAMHTFALALLGAFFLSGRVRVDIRRLGTFAAISLLVVIGFVVGCRVLLTTILPAPESAAGMFDRLRISGRTATLDTALSAPQGEMVLPNVGHRLDEILSRGSLRACVSPDALPWCFTNGRGEVVGFEVDLAHAMAVELNVRLALVSVARLARGTALANGTCDVATGRVMPSEANTMTFSRPIAYERWAFLTLDHRRNDYASLDRARALPSPQIAVIRVREWMDHLATQLPNAIVVPVESVQDFIDAPAGRFDAMFTGFDRAAAYSLAFPRFAAVAPAPSLGSVPLAIVVPKGEEALVDFANALVEVGQANGTIDDKLAYWVHGKGPVRDREPRWSFGGNVLGWWRD